MAIDGIYFEDKTITTSTAIKGKGTNEMDMNDFMNLLVAQMTNQDMLNPQQDTEFIAQMAQFSSLQGINTIQEYQLSNYAASYAGKYVTIANQTAAGTLETITGYVEAVNFYDGTPKVQVNGKNYEIYTIMEVSDKAGSGTLSDAAQYIGKTITVTTKNELDEDREVTGRVTGVTIKDNVPHVIIDGESYPVSAIKELEEAEDETVSAGDSASEAAAQAQSYDAAVRARIAEINDMDDPDAVARRRTATSGTNVAETSTTDNVIVDSQTINRYYR